MIKEFEQYIPSVEEIELAEKKMNDRQRKSSETRAENWEQRQAPWDDYEENFNENGERKKPTAEEAEKMSLLIIELGRLLKEADLKWRMDGAINISLMKGEFIGVHKDIDISVERNDLEELAVYLEKKGYAFFHSFYPEGSEEIVRRRVSHNNVASSMFGNYMIIAVDQNGKIVKNKKPNFIDLHIIERNLDGFPVNSSGVVLPEEWFKPQLINYKSENINLSHPALVAYYKLQHWRGYDLADLNVLAEAGKLTSQDIREIEEIIEKNFISNEQKGKDIFNEMATRIKGGMSSSEIFHILAEHSVLKDGIQHKKELFATFSEKIAESNDKSSNFIIKLAFEIFDVEDTKKQMRNKVNTLKQWVVGYEKKKI